MCTNLLERTKLSKPGTRIEMNASDRHRMENAIIKQYENETNWISHRDGRWHREFLNRSKENLNIKKPIESHNCVPKLYMSESFTSN